MIQIHHQWHGPEGGPVLVLINGLLTDMRRWAAQLPAYAEKHQVLTYDCRGQGQSAKPEDGPYTPALHAQDLKDLLDRLGVEQAVLMGVSNGTCIALEFAIRWPERVRGLVLANGYGRVDPALQFKFQTWLTAWEVGGGPLHYEISTPWIWGATFINQNHERLKPHEGTGSGFPLHAVQHLIRGSYGFDVLDQAAAITCPTLLLAGDEDLFTPLTYSHELQRRIFGSQIVLLREAGHCMFLEQPEQCTRAILAFLTQHGLS
ncbi:MAG TPA: alpha/beta fold hydrolase [Symbiobacteriaceae bacterium]|nr:alpha/beta fold hydrolase [Symbiobacteriaceae bacterium]